MGEISRFIEAAIITALFTFAALFVNSSAVAGCDGSKAVTAKIERGPNRIFIN